ncbi:MAG TPA: FkbM family methyltransferase [Methylocella sp.]
MLQNLISRTLSSVQAMLRRAPQSSPQATTRYKIGELIIELNPEHRLPLYQSQHRLYDRFLPVLCRRLEPADHWIIDVGANVGDTAIAIAQACANPILCVEGDAEYFDLLKRNVENLLSARERPTRCVKVLVGTGRFSGSLERDGTTAGLAQDIAGDHRAVPLDEVVREAGLPTGEIALVKVDTDGYDSDVILSATGVLAASRPILFWENYFSSRAQIRDLDQLYQCLEDMGYRYFWAFDNFGNLMLEECSVKNIRDLNAYVASQEFHGCTRTIWYTDILAASENNLSRAREAVEDFCSSIVAQGGTGARPSDRSEAFGDREALQA